MSVSVRRFWTQQEFLAWHAEQEGRYEFDGTQPVAMAGGSIAHSIMVRNLHRALDARLRTGPCQPLGPEAGVITLGGAIRYPDALVTCAQLDVEALTVPGVVVVFEVVSPSSVRIDRVIKVREYAAVATIRQYVIIEANHGGLMNLTRAKADDEWTATALTPDDVLVLSELGLTIPVGEFYLGLTQKSDSELL